MLAVDFDHDFKDDYFATKYGRMHYKHHKGSSNPVVFLHGFAASMKSWTRLANYLPSSLDIHLIDLLGHGSSDAPGIEYSLHMHYETIREFIKGNCGNNTVLFGHSYGGWVAAYYAANDGCNGLVLEDSAGLSEFIKERHTLNPRYREDMVKRALPLNPRENVLKSMLHADNSNTQLDEKVLGKVKCKCMIIWGRDDAIVDPKYAERFSRYITGSGLEIIDGAKHTPHYSNPDKVATLLLDFLKIS